MRRGGFTFVEVLIATLIALVVLSATMQLLVSGSRLFASGMSAARGPEAAVILMDRMEEDISRVVQIPGDPRPPMAVSGDGARLAFYRSSPELSTEVTIVGAPASWGLEPAGGGLSHPVIDGKVQEDLLLLGWQFRLLEPDLDEARPGWFLEVLVRFDTGRLLGPGYAVRRLIHLAQPSANFIHFPAHGKELLEGMVQLLPRPPDPLFDGLGPATLVAPGPKGAGA